MNPTSVNNTGGQGSTIVVEDLRTHFFTRRGVVRAVDGVSFSVNPGQTLGLVGESGCGKTITCLSILRLVPQPAGRIVSGRILWNGENLLEKSETEIRRIRGRHISMILQDPMSSLNPLFSIGAQVAEPIKKHQGLRGRALRERVQEMLGLVNIPSPEIRFRDYPHQFSGGMRQRVVGAIALSCQPGLLIADEPTTSLDVSTQAQYLSFLKDLQKQRNFAAIFVTHDFGIVAKVCDVVAVMYAGRIVEIAPVLELFDQPAHPYTQALMRSVPTVEKKVESLFNIEGEPPDLSQGVPGCPFAPRCTQASDQCQKTEATFPPDADLGNGHRVACWKYC